MTIKLTPQEVINWLLWFADQVIAVGLALIFTAIIIRQWGVSNPWLPTMDATNLAYLAGAWWLARKARQ